MCTLTNVYLLLIFLAYTFVVSSSVINATAMLSVPHISTAFHSIIVTCTIHMSSEADKCQVIVGGDNMFTSGRCNVHVHVHVLSYYNYVTV